MSHVWIVIRIAKDCHGNTEKFRLVSVYPWQEYLPQITQIDTDGCLLISVNPNNLWQKLL